MSRQTFTRRRVVSFLVGSAAGAVTFGCRPTSTLESSTGDPTLAFAEPWRTVLGDAVPPFGQKVVLVERSAIDHARRRLERPGGLGADSDLLRAACLQDAEEGSFSQIDGWILPTTLAGLAGALAPAWNEWQR
jgi:hypothetical protein